MSVSVESNVEVWSGKDDYKLEQQSKPILRAPLYLYGLGA